MQPAFGRKINNFFTALKQKGLIIKPHDGLFLVLTIFLFLMLLFTIQLPKAGQETQSVAIGSTAQCKRYDCVGEGWKSNRTYNCSELYGKKAGCSSNPECRWNEGSEVCEGQAHKIFGCGVAKSEEQCNNPGIVTEEGVTGSCGWSCVEYETPPKDKYQVMVEGINNELPKLKEYQQSARQSGDVDGAKYWARRIDVLEKALTGTTEQKEAARDLLTQIEKEREDNAQARANQMNAQITPGPNSSCPPGDLPCIAGENAYNSCVAQGCTPDQSENARNDAFNTIMGDAVKKANRGDTIAQQQVQLYNALEDQLHQMEAQRREEEERRRKEEEARLQEERRRKEEEAKVAPTETITPEPVLSTSASPSPATETDVTPTTGYSAEEEAGIAEAGTAIDPLFDIFNGNINPSTVTTTPAKQATPTFSGGGNTGGGGGGGGSSGFGGEDDAVSGKTTTTPAKQATPTFSGGGNTGGGGGGGGSSGFGDTTPAQGAPTTTVTESQQDKNFKKNVEKINSLFDKIGQSFQNMGGAINNALADLGKNLILLELDLGIPLINTGVGMGLGNLPIGTNNSSGNSGGGGGTSGFGDYTDTVTPAKQLTPTAARVPTAPPQITNTIKPVISSGTPTPPGQKPLVPTVTTVPAPQKPNPQSSLTTPYPNQITKAVTPTPTPAQQNLLQQIFSGILKLELDLGLPLIYTGIGAGLGNGTPTTPTVLTPTAAPLPTAPKNTPSSSTPTFAPQITTTGQSNKPNQLTPTAARVPTAPPKIPSSTLGYTPPVIAKTTSAPLKLYTPPTSVKTTTPNPVTPTVYTYTVPESFNPADFLAQGIESILNFGPQALTTLFGSGPTITPPPFVPQTPTKAPAPTAPRDIFILPTKETTPVYTISPSFKQNQTTPTKSAAPSPSTVVTTTPIKTITPIAYATISPANTSSTPTVKIIQKTNTPTPPKIPSSTLGYTPPVIAKTTSAPLKLYTPPTSVKTATPNPITPTIYTYTVPESFNPADFVAQSIESILNLGPQALTTLFGNGPTITPSPLAPTNTPAPKAPLSINTPTYTPPPPPITQPVSSPATNNTAKIPTSTMGYTPPAKEPTLTIKPITATATILTPTKQAAPSAPKIIPSSSTPTFAPKTTTAVKSQTPTPPAKTTTPAKALPTIYYITPTPEPSALDTIGNFVGGGLNSIKDIFEAILP